MVTTLPANPLLDLAPYVGQRQASFRFTLYDFVTKQSLGEIHPRRDTVPTLSHDTSRVIVRQIDNCFFDKFDTANINTISARVIVEMIIRDESYPLGTYMFIDQVRSLSTGGVESATTLVDSMFIVDQQLEQTYSAGTFAPDGSIISLRQVDAAIGDVLTGIPVSYTTEPSPYYTIGVWPSGSTRGRVLNDLAIDGDYLAPWFDHENELRFIRTFDPATVTPQFDYDANHVVYRDSISFTDDLLTAPNRYIVISNGDVSGNMTVPIVGVYDVPTSAPHSADNRGFVIPEIISWQVDNATQATAIATNIGQRQTVFERVEFDTPPDPRHDGYDVFKFNDQQWLEIAWSLQLIEGGVMHHVGRKAYL